MPAGACLLALSVVVVGVSMKVKGSRLDAVVWLL
jgi:hypothetical protein